jgi:hypothetical protein
LALGRGRVDADKGEDDAVDCALLEITGTLEQPRPHTCSALDGDTEPI